MVKTYQELVAWQKGMSLVKAVYIFAHFLSQARGSLFEVETQLLIAKDLGFVGDVTPELELSSELGKILNGLIRKLTPAS